MISRFPADEANHAFVQKHLKQLQFQLDIFEEKNKILIGIQIINRIQGTNVYVFYSITYIIWFINTFYVINNAIKKAKLTRLLIWLKLSH